MAVTATNVAAGKPKVTGAISAAALGSTLPTDATTALDAAFTTLGYVSDDGLTQTIERTVENVRAWGGDTVLTTQTEFLETFTFQLIEVLNVDVRKEVFGQINVTGTLATGITTTVNASELTARAWAIDMVVNGAVTRIVIPNGKVSEIGDIEYVDDDAIRYPVTVTALPDASGNNSYEYTKSTN